MPVMAQQMGIETIGTFHKRRGDQALLDQYGVASGAWMRLLGEKREQQWSSMIAGINYQLAPKIDGHLWGIQIGLDLFGRETAWGQDRVGVFYTHTETSGTIYGNTLAVDGARSGRLALQGDSIGGYWTNVGRNGWYVDAVAMYTWLNANAASDRRIGAKSNGSAVTASLEGGAPFQISQRLTLEPQAQIVWQHVNLGNTRDPFTTINYESFDAVTGRLGLRLEDSTFVNNAPLQSFLSVNIWHDFSQTANVVFNDRNVATRMEGTSLELRGGLSTQLTRNVAAYGSLGYMTNLGEAYRQLLPDDPDLQRIVVGDAEPDDIEYGKAIAAESDRCPTTRIARSDPAFIIYTSGSTGQPKGCVIAANILMAMWSYVRHSLDLRPDTDVFWPTGDPSWGYGLCCYLPALAAGATVISVEANASVSVCLDIISRSGVTNFATNPTVLRGLMAEGEIIEKAGTTIRAISCCGEPLNGEVVNFFQRVWGCTPMDHFGATEFGLPIGNHNAFDMAVKPGSMGLPAPGQRMGIVDEAGQDIADGEVGLIGQRTDANTQYWLRYWDDEAATAALYRGGWACTGDLARRDDDGYFWFEGRSDDIIKSSGYRIGPFEIESALLQYPGVTEAAAIGVPDSIRGEAIKAFVVMRPPPRNTEQTIDELVRLVKSSCGRHVAPREIVFLESLPKTQTGKIQRFLLRNASLEGNAKP